MSNRSSPPQGGDLLEEIMIRLIRVESRVTQIMNHLGVTAALSAAARTIGNPFKSNTTSLRVDEISTRLVRVESRIVQLMNHFGIKPKGMRPTREKP